MPPQHSPHGHSWAIIRWVWDVPCYQWVNMQVASVVQLCGGVFHSLVTLWLHFSLWPAIEDLLCAFLLARSEADAHLPGYQVRTFTPKLSFQAFQQNLLIE